MIEEPALVVGVEHGFAWVETRRAGTCGACAAHRSCGTAALERHFGARRRRVRALDRIGTSPGDQVVVGLPEGALVKGSLAVYRMPLLGLLMGGGVVEALGIGSSGGAELPVVAGGLAGLVLALAWLRRFTRRIAADEEYQPVVLQRLSPSSLFPKRSLPGR
jgi:sigma-E factor negative regulatory protein RseC